MSDDGNPYEAPRARLIDGAAGRTPGAAVIKRPWRSILLRPRITFRDLKKFPRPSWLLPLAALYGIATTLDDAWTSAGIANYFSWHRWALLAIPAGIALGTVILYLFSWALLVAARMLGGQGDAVQTRVAYAWSCLPFAPYIAVELGAYWRLQESIFVISPPVPGQMRPLVLLLAARSLATLWALIIAVAGVSVMHRISLPRACGALVIAVIGAWLGAQLLAVAAEMIVTVVPI